MDQRAWKKLAPIAIAAVAATGWLGSHALDSADDSPGHEQVASERNRQTGDAHAGSDRNTNTCPVKQLPREAAEQIEDILNGAVLDDGYHDGKHFGNYEGVLPREKSDYYREYTVATPGVNHRGERRIVVGGGSKNDPDVWFYSDDHFQSFCRIPDAEK